MKTERPSSRRSATAHRQPDCQRPKKRHSGKTRIRRGKEMVQGKVLTELSTEFVQNPRAFFAQYSCNSGNWPTVRRWHPEHCTIFGHIAEKAHQKPVFTGCLWHSHTLIHRICEEPHNSRPTDGNPLLRTAGAQGGRTCTKFSTDAGGATAD